MVCWDVVQRDTENRTDVMELRGWKKRIGKVKPLSR